MTELFSIVTAAHDQWEEFTAPLIASLRQCEPKVPLVVVDSDSKPEYPKQIDDYTTVIRTDNESHAKSINLGLVHCPISEWYLILDNDTLVYDKIGEVIRKLDPFSLYGGEVRHWKYGYYAVGWCFLIPRRILLKIGLFDENYIKILYEETDYCYRATKKNFGIQHVKNIPIVHVNGGGGSRRYVDSEKLTQVNLGYFLAKHRLDWMT